MSEREPGRLPAGLMANGFSSSSLSSVDSEVRTNGNHTPSNAALAELLRQRLGLDAGEEDNVLMFDDGADGGDEAESLLDYDPDEEDVHMDGGGEDEEDEEIIFEEVDESVADQIGLEKFRTPAECMIKTQATIVIHKKKDGAVSGASGDPVHRPGYLPNDRPSLTQVRERELLICVPAMKMKESLKDRFERQNQRMMKRDLTPEQKLLNYLRFRGENGFKHVFKGTAGAKAKLAERIKILQETGLKPTMFDRFLHEAADDHFDHESFWREQVATWIAKYEWRRREGPEVSKSELDKEIEEWMAQRGSGAFSSTQDMEQDLSNFMSGRGIDMQTREQLDNDMDDYWAKKGQQIGTTDDDTDNTSTVTSIHSGRSSRQNSVTRNQDYNEADLDKDLNDYLCKRGTAGVNGTNGTNGGSGQKEGGMETETESTASSAYSSLLLPKKQVTTTGPKPLTPQERMRRAAAARRLTPVVQTPATATALDDDLDSYFSRQKMLEQQAVKQEEEELKKKEEETAAAAVGEGDRFADGDFDEIDEELEWQ